MDPDLDVLLEEMRQGGIFMPHHSRVVDDAPEPVSSARQRR